MSKLRAALVVFLVGFALGLTVFLVSRLYVRSILTAEAAVAAQELSAELAMGQRVGTETLTGISQYAVFDSEGRLIQSGGRPGSAGRLDDLLAPEAASEGVPAGIFDLRSFANLMGLTDLSVRRVTVPVLRDGKPVGTVAAIVHQSAAVDVLSRSLSAAGMVVVSLAVLAALAVAAMFSRSLLAGRGKAVDASRMARDRVTGLLTRDSFIASLEDVVHRATAADSQVGLVAVELSRFRAVNDTWGHSVGDKVLAAAAERLRTLAPPGAILSRISGATFALTLQRDADTHSIRQLGEDIHRVLTAPIEIDASSIALGARIGVAQFPVNADTADVLFRAADVALSRAKEEGRPNLCFFDTEMGKRMRRRSALERDLRRALERDEFVLFYQPQLELASGKVRGYEALVRWERPGEGIVSPADFLVVAEETGLIRPLGEWVLRRACTDAVGWTDEGTVSVNFSGAQFAYPDVDRRIAAILAETGLPAARLEIEVPESLFLRHDSEVMATLQRIKDLGVRVAMDDFGTGYSSLAALSRFPFDKIKIDRSFVHQLAADPEVAAIVSSVVGLGRSLSVDVTAEGVETQEQVTLLKAAGCSIVQGFLFGVPRRASAEAATASAAAASR